MLCPECQCEMIIKDTRYVTEKDAQDESKIRLYIEQDLYCRNRKCSNFDKLVKTVRNELKVN